MLTATGPFVMRTAILPPNQKGASRPPFRRRQALHDHWTIRSPSICEAAPRPRLQRPARLSAIRCADHAQV